MIDKLIDWLRGPKSDKRKSIRYLRSQNIDGRRGLSVIDIELYIKEAIEKMRRDGWIK